MAGIIVGGVVGLLLIGGALTGEIYDDSPSALMLAAVGMWVAAVLLGTEFKRTMGMAGLGWMVGGIVAAATMLFRFEWLYAYAMGLHALCAFGLQRVSSELGQAVASGSADGLSAVDADLVSLDLQ